MGTDNERLLVVEDLKTYFVTKQGIVKAVDGVSFSVNRGEIVGLVGESGCGKSMTSLSILRLVPQPAGKILNGKIIFKQEDLLEKSEEEMRELFGQEVPEAIDNSWRIAEMCDLDLEFGHLHLPEADVPPGVAIAAVTTIGYLGSFTGPPAIGAFAELSSLNAALGLLVAVSALMLLLAPAGLAASMRRQDERGATVHDRRRTGGP